ncbi:hypothetical protein RJ640_023600 [Escallonia rubra]|uniref:Uncharacterized protein n=1 Tax=Escallonia rubra TaxID=112253 RepID=A0AA88RAQ1_9ASTE|nr:hypothetical protein RJ640_023600 [Escallonia rubra]
MPQNLITCIYQAQLRNSPTYLTLTWSKTPFSHSLTIQAPDSFSITISLNPSTFSFFGNRPGSKSIYLTHHHYDKVKLYWDFTRAEYTDNSAEPKSSFYIAVTCNARLEFLMGDLRDELTRRSGFVTASYSAKPSLLSRREHVFGHRNYATQAEFMGSKHDIEVECGGGVLKVKVDGELRLVVKRLAWKFRGNERITIDGLEVEFYWDVFNWVSDSTSKGGGHGVFVFQVGDGGVWQEMVGPEKKLMRKSLSAAAAGSATVPPVSLSPSPSCSSVLQWAEESSDGSRSSCSSSTRSCGGGGGFTLLLYAWRRH